MGRFLGFLLFLVSFSAGAALPGGAPVVQQGYDPAAAVAGQIIDGNSLSKGISVTCGMGKTATGAATYYRCTKMGSTTANFNNYQVTTGKIAYCNGFLYSTAAVQYFLFGYTTAVAVTNNSTTAPPTEFDFGNAIAGGAFPLASTATVLKWAPIPMQFPGGSFPFMFVTESTATDAILVCQEQ